MEESKTGGCEQKTVTGRRDKEAVNMVNSSCTLLNHRKNYATLNLGWRDGPEAKSAYWTYRGPKLGCPAPTLGTSQLPALGYPVPSTGLCRPAPDIHNQNLKKEIFKNYVSHLLIMYIM